ncbi:hypothetical protein ABPG75_003877 [Micractinium tetrahymenae]
MGANLSTPEKIAKLARQGDAQTLEALLTDLRRNDSSYAANRARYLESRDDHGNTPLTAAAARGHLPVVRVLLRFGASIHAVNLKPDGGSALHEAVAHKHEAVVELLLSHGANPFVENSKGFTAVDIACSTRNVPLLRRLEQCAPYVGWLLVKVPQFGGLGSSWQRRWVVVSHRYPNPAAPPARQLTHCVFLAYKTLANTAPSCRVWLDGARAREVYNPKAEARLQVSAVPGAPRVAQAGVTLHRKHEQPSGVYTTGGHAGPNGEIVEGYTFYLRPEDGSQRSIDALDKLIRTVNNRGFPPDPLPPRPQQAQQAPQQLGQQQLGQQQQQQQQQQQSGPLALPPPGPGPLYSSMLAFGAGGAAAGANAALSTPNMATAPGTWGADYAEMAALSAPPMAGTESDEQIARRLQEEYDAEVAQQLQQQQDGGPPLSGSGQPRPQAAPPPGATSAAAPQQADYLTGGSFYPQVHHAEQPGSAPPVGAPGALQHSGGSAPPQLAGALQAAAAGASGSLPGPPGAPLPATQSYGRPSAPTLLDMDYPPPAVGVGPDGRPQHLPISVSGRHQSAPRLEDDSWWSSTPAVPPSRAHSEMGPGAAAAAAVASAPPGLAGAGGSGSCNPFDADPDTCVVCLDAPATAGVLHGDSVHKCLCKDCAAMLKADKIENCPMCREKVDAYIMRVF